MARGRVDILRHRAERLGTVEAANANEAIKIAAKEFDIPPERQNWIAVEKVSKSKDRPLNSFQELRARSASWRTSGRKSEAPLSRTRPPDERNCPTGSAFLRKRRFSRSN